MTRERESKQPEALRLADALWPWHEGMTNNLALAAAELRRLHVEAETWKRLYRLAVSEANGLTNYVEDRAELYSAEKRLTKIQEEARAMEATLKEKNT